MGLAVLRMRADAREGLPGTTEPTTIRTRDGRRKNGSLRYTIRPIQEAVDHYHERQMVKLEETTEAQRLRERLEDYDKKRGISGR